MTLSERRGARPRGPHRRGRGDDSRRGARREGTFADRWLRPRLPPPGGGRVARGIALAATIACIVPLAASLYVVVRGAAALN